MSSPVWHPFTQHALRPSLPMAVKAQGAYITTADGRQILDAISSWWVITHGHRHPRIVAAIQAQADQLDQVIFAEFTHEPAESLARQLLFGYAQEDMKVILAPLARNAEEAVSSIAEPA